MNTVKINEASNVLKKLHKDAQKDMMRIASAGIKSVFRPMGPKDFENAYLPISKEQGQNIKELIIENNCKSIVEFGTSFGISTIYLAQGAQQTAGKITSTELLESKANRALKNITEAGLGDYVEIKIGDAMQTLQNFNEPVDFLFLDGWKDLYLPLFKMLSPLFHTDTLIYADNMDMNGTQEFKAFLDANDNKFNTQWVDDGKATLTSLV